MKLFIFEPCQTWGYMGGVVGVIADTFEDVQAIVDKHPKESALADGDDQHAFARTNAGQIDCGFQGEYFLYAHEPSDKWGWVLKHVIDLDSNAAVWSAIAHGKGSIATVSPKVLFASGNNA